AGVGMRVSHVTGLQTCALPILPNEPFFTINTNVQYRLNNIFQRQSVMNLYYNLGYVGEFYIVWGQPEWSKTPTQFAHDFGASYRPEERRVAKRRKGIGRPAH